jgi:glycosyltransferase involved in cell wall biosynthesis
MKILIISSYIPMPDHTSGDLRFYTLLKLIAELHQVSLYPCHLQGQTKEIGEASTQYYIKKIEDINISLVSKNALTTLKNEQFNLVIFEFYYCVRSYIDFVRLYQPQAKILIDSVDIHYNRFASKAALTGKISDFEYAEIVKKKELAAYQQADLIIVVTEDDKQVIKKDAPNTKTVLLPNIHRIPEFTIQQPPYNRLIFVGAFNHEPNVDAILYFCNEIFPLLLEMNSNFILEIIGSNPPDSIQTLQSDKVFVRGFVENIDEHYHNAHISIAPLRFGGGMKGKIGEALSFSLPVVTTKIGIEGFGLSPDENIMVAETAEDFANSIFQISEDGQLYKKLSINGYNFIKNNYSEEVTRIKLLALINQASSVTPKKIAVLTKIILWLKITYNHYVGWRFQHV